jgi:hypothetical protein
MTPWCAGKLIEQRTNELVAAHRRTGGPRHRQAGRISVWCGYRMINLGSRLLRPALVAGAGA